MFYTATSPLITDGKCIIHTGSSGKGGGKGALTAYDLGNGEEKWKWDGDGPGYGSPVVATIRGVKQVVEQTDTNLVGVRIQDSRDIKLYRQAQHPVLRGLAYIRDERTAYLWSRGYVPRLRTYPGREVPNPLLIDVCKGNVPIDVVLRDILALTKVNYNSCIFADRVPVTLRFANAVGEILTAGPPGPIPPLPFKYYI